MFHGDLHLPSLVEEWEEGIVFSTFTFGNFLYVKMKTDQMAAHHHGFNQGVQSALVLRERHNSKEEQTSNGIWYVCALLGGIGTAGVVYTVAKVDSVVALVVACLVAGPCIILHLAGTIMLVLSWLKPYTKESNVVPIEYDPDKRARYFEEKEARAVEEFFDSGRGVGGHDPGEDV